MGPAMGIFFCGPFNVAEQPSVNRIQHVDSDVRILQTSDCRHTKYAGRLPAVRRLLTFLLYLSGLLANQVGLERTKLGFKNDTFSYWTTSVTCRIAGKYAT